MKDFIYHREGERIGVSVPKEITEEDIGLIIGTLLGKTVEKGGLDRKKIVHVFSKVVNAETIHEFTKELNLVDKSMQEEDVLFQRTEGLN